MCGIAGIYNYISQIEHSNEIIVKRMLSVIDHRGPDESGAYVNDNIGLGSVRLSIIDLASGQQPMADISKRYWIVYNGELFNYKELKVDLKKKGIKFKTNSDTEVVIQMYATYGVDCLKYFNGQFAFCIWDKIKDELFLARDRVGIRPLFYWNQKQMFAFCSEIKGLLTLDQVQTKINSDGLSQIFTFWSTVSPITPFENIFELQPGHFMLVNKNEKKINQYWSLEFQPEQVKQNVKIEESTDELFDLLNDAVKIRLRADVPIGAYLSGGLDSSLTTALISKIYPDNLNTFSISFDEESYDETKYQQKVSQYLNTNHSSFFCTSDDILENFTNTIWHTEYPILRTSPTPMYLLSKKVHENNIKVVITGEGADEILGGYNIFKEAKVRRFWANQPDSKIRPKLLSKLYPYLPQLKDSSDFSLKMFFGYKLTDIDNPFYSHLLRWHNTSRLKSFFNIDFSKSIQSKDHFAEIQEILPKNYNNWSLLSKSQYLETSIFMSEYLLSSQGDRMAMGNSVEGRYPFLDYRVIEFCSKLPDSFKLNGLNEKYILKRLSSGKIPEIITKRSKQAYRAPISNSFLSPNGIKFMNEILSDNSLKNSGIFDPNKVNSLISKTKKQLTISEIDQMAITGIVSTQILFDKFISNSIRANHDQLKNYRLINECTNKNN